VIKRIFILCLALASLGLSAQGRGGSIGVSGSEAGVGVDITYTGYSKIGIVAGFGGASRQDKDLPAEGYFSYIDYSHRDWKSKTVFYVGPAFQVNQNITVGVAYASYTREDYFSGVSYVTGWEWRYGTESKTKSGVALVLDFGSARGIGAHIYASSAISGAGITYRF
jgi:hypothetical protein